MQLKIHQSDCMVHIVSYTHRDLNVPDYRPHSPKKKSELLIQTLSLPRFGQDGANSPLPLPSKFCSTSPERLVKET